MNVTKDVINDLYPLYVEKECSADSRALVEEYLQLNPQHAEELRRVMNTPLPGAVPPAKGLEEMESLRKTRRLVRRRLWLLVLAITFSLTPFSLVFSSSGHYWLFRESPTTALIYGALGVGCWIAYAVMRSRSNGL